MKGKVYFIRELPPPIAKEEWSNLRPIVQGTIRQSLQDTDSRRAPCLMYSSSILFIVLRIIFPNTFVFFFSPEFSQNRLQRPDEMEIVELEPCFRNIKVMNLSENNLKSWDNVMYLSRLWNHIERLVLGQNNITSLHTSAANKHAIFTHLR